MKAIYDKYGEYGLKEGVVGPDGKIMGGGYFVKCNSNEIYEKEFTATDPWEYQDCFTEKMNYGSMFAASVGGMQQKSEVVPQDIEITLTCTLEEFYNGSLKEIKFSRSVMKDNARTTE
jgi:DnaJ-class molecular chaperone